MTASAALERLRDAASAPRDVSRSLFTVGVVGRDVPLELIDAAGARAVRLRGRPGLALDAADSYLGTGIDPAARSMLAALLAEDFAGLDAILVSSDSEASQRLFYLLRELRRVEPRIPVPPVHLVDVQHLPRESSLAYTRAKLDELRTLLETWTSTAITADALGRAVAARDELRTLLARASAARTGDSPRLTGAQFVDLVVSDTHLPPEEHRDLVREVLDELETLPIVAGPPFALPLLLTGSPHDEAGVVRAIEAAGARVVGEDHDAGAASLGRLVGEPSLDGLARHYADNGPTPPRATIMQRAALTAEVARQSGARAVLAYVRQRDDAPLWDFAAQSRLPGLPAHLLDGQQYAAVDADRLGDAIAALRQELAGD